MRKYLYSILLLLPCHFAHSQHLYSSFSSIALLRADCSDSQNIISKNNYISVVSSRNEWIAKTYPLFDPITIDRYTFSVDSFFYSGFYFHELLFSKDMSSPWNSTGKYFRQEGSKVFKLTGDTLKLLYDFSLNIGDTLVPFNDGIYDKREVVEVGSIMLLDNIPRKYLSITCGSQSGGDTTKWIEGIGDIDRFLWSDSFCSNFDDGGYNELLCFSSDGQTVYMRPGNESCYSNSIESINPSVFEVFPNPCTNFIFAESKSESNPECISIYDVYGNLAIRFKEPVRNQNLDVSILPQGYYFGIIQTKHNTIYSFKLIKTN